MVDYILQLHEAGILLAAFWLAFCSLCYTLFQKRTAKVQNKIFVWLLVIIMLDSASDICTIFQTPFCDTYLYARILVELSTFVYFVTHTMLCPLLYFYILFASGAMIQRRSIGKGNHPLSYIPFLIAEALVILNPFLHWVWYFDSNFGYHRNAGVGYIYACAGIYFFLAIGTMFSRRRAIAPGKRWALFVFALLNVLGLLVQMAYSSLHTELFVQALTLTGVMLTIENEDERIDLATRVYNRGALTSDLNQFCRLGTRFSVICIRITNSDMLQRLLGVIDSDMLLFKVAEYLKSVHPAYYIYRPTMQSFLLIVMENEEKT